MSTSSVTARFYRRLEADADRDAERHAYDHVLGVAQLTITLNPMQAALIAGRLANVSSVAGIFGSELRDLKRQRAPEIRMDTLAVLADRFPDLVEALHQAEPVRRMIRKVEGL